MKIIDSNSHFNEIAEEIKRSFKTYSDIKIVSRDGQQHDANKSILSRDENLSKYLDLNKFSEESKPFKIFYLVHSIKWEQICDFVIETWLFLPDVSSEEIAEALNWFYDTSISSDESESFTKKIFGNVRDEKHVGQLSEADSMEIQDVTLDYDKSCLEVVSPEDFISWYEAFFEALP